MKFLLGDTPRSLEDIDRLAQTMNFLANKLGEEKAKKIEANPAEFYDGNKFRYFQAKGYHRSIPFAFFATLGGVFAIGGYEHSHRILRKRPLFILGAGFLIFMASQKVFEYKAGYRDIEYTAHTYAKYIIMTRNLRIKG